jgi:hypothetical protein
MLRGGMAVVAVGVAQLLKRFSSHHQYQTTYT